MEIESVDKICGNDPLLKALQATPSFERALELNWCSWAYAYGLSPENLSHVVEKDNIRFTTGLAVGFLNLVAWSDISRENIKERVLEITDSCTTLLRDKQVSIEWGVIGTQQNLQPLTDALESASWKFSYATPGMTCDLMKRPAVTFGKNFTIERVRTPRQVHDWLIPFMEAFEIHEEARSYLQTVFEKMASDENHSFRHYLIRDNEIPLTAGSIQFKYDVAVIYNITTTRAGRGKGGASLMVEHLKGEACKAGSPSVSLFAFEAGRGVYKRAGFIPNNSSYKIFELGNFSK
jgi:hypothetical protein